MFCVKVMIMQYRSIEKIRLDNLKFLISSFSSPAEFSRYIGRNKAYIAQYISTNAKVNIGSKIAREIEEKLSKPFGWMDADHDRESNLAKNLVSILNGKGFDADELKEVVCALFEISQ